MLARRFHDLLFARQTRRKPRRDGFVLLMTLAIIAMAGIVLVGMARYSLSISTEARRARADLQGRWGARSLSRALLKQSRSILKGTADSEVPDESSDSPLTWELQLGEVTFDVALDDESAKLNVNRLYAIGGSEEIYLGVHELGGARHCLSLTPSSSRFGHTRYRPFDSWGQVFAMDDLPLDEPMAAWLQARTGRITCWGDGRIHLARAPDDVLYLAALRAAGPTTATQLVTLRRRNPQLGLPELLDLLDTRYDAVARLKGWLRDDSNCFSLWITAESEGYQMAELYIAEFTLRDSMDIMRFTW